MTEDQPKTDRIFCNQCGHETKHLLIANRQQYGSSPDEDGYEISWETIYDIFECCGCEDVTLRRKYYFSEWDHGDVEIVYYPPRIGRRLPPWKKELSEEMGQLLEEVYAALQADSRRLAIMGTRALIDIIILNEVGDAGTFAQKLEKLQTAGFISVKNREVLDAALDVGHAASHRGYQPQSKHVHQVIDIVENLLQATILQKTVDGLRNSTPERKKAMKK
jgi:hypothetical protein